MKHPIPSKSPAPLKIGDRVRIVPEWQDPGADPYERLVIEAPADSTRVSIRTFIPGLLIYPIDWIEADKLVHLPPITNNI